MRISPFDTTVSTRAIGLSLLIKQRNCISELRYGVASGRGRWSRTWVSGKAGGAFLALNNDELGGDGESANRAGIKRLDCLFYENEWPWPLFSRGVRS